MTAGILRDTWGIPHIRAESPLELSYAQGHNAATDRGWQIEVERHRSQGTSAAFLGAGSLPFDVFARRAAIGTTARRCHERLAADDPDTAEWLAAYVAGVNDGLAEGAGGAPEFARAGIEPGHWEPWVPLGVWLTVHILFTGFPTKFWRERVARELGEEHRNLFATDGPAGAGSNGWLLSGARTASGMPLLAGDPHRFLEDPGVYQQIQLSCPEFDVLGLAVPGVPGIAHFGHAGGVAWCITNAMADYQDVYEERLRRRAGGLEALGPQGWRPVTSRTETVSVAGGDPVRVEVHATERGPVIVDGRGTLASGPEPGSEPGSGFGWESDSEPGPDGTELSALSLRHPTWVTADLGFGALPALLRARTVADVDRAFDGWAEPVNVVQAADTEGGLLHRTAGRVPVRDDANSRGPVPAWDPRYVWSTDWAPAERAEPGEIAVMANDRSLAAPLGCEFAPPHRARRIRELLAASGDWSVEDMHKVHLDTRLDPGNPLMAHLRTMAPHPDTAAETLRRQLLGWDGHMDAGSTDALAYAELRAEVARRLTAHPPFAPLSAPTGLPAVFAPWTNTAVRVGFALDTLLTTPLPGLDALAEIRAALRDSASRPPQGTWGEAHLPTPWQAMPGETTEVWPGVGGDHDCVLSTSSLPGLTHRFARASAARFVWDLADRDRSLWVVPLGASGVPGSPHHRDQLPQWAAGALVPATGDWERLVERHGPLLPLRSRQEQPLAPGTRPSAVSDRPAPPVTALTPLPTAPQRPPAPPRNTMTAPVPPPAAESAVLLRHEVPGHGSFAVRRVVPALDAALLHSWVSTERARFWGMTGHTAEQVHETYAHLDSLESHHAYLVLCEDRPVALLHTYDPAADRVSECYEVQEGDLGIHLFVSGASEGRRPGFTGALVRVLWEFTLGSGRCHRLVVEPDAANERALDRLARVGFTFGPETVLPGVDLPEVHLPAKRARLAFLTAGTVAAPAPASAADTATASAPAPAPAPAPAAN